MMPIRVKRQLVPFTGAGSYDLLVIRNHHILFVIEFRFPDKRPRGEFHSRVRRAQIAVRRTVWDGTEWKRGMALVERETLFTNTREAQRWERDSREGVIAEMMKYID